VADPAKAAILSLILLSLTLGAFLAQRKWLGKKNYATVTGKGLPGYTATLFCGNIACGSVLIGASGTFSIPSTFRKSGTTVLSVTQMDSAGRESDRAAASQAVILQPPGVTSIGPEDRTGVIVGQGAPGATVTV
jgi:hypothetical protein